MGLFRATYMISGIFRQAEHNMDRSAARRASKRTRKNRRHQAYLAQRESYRREQAHAAFVQQETERQARIDAAYRKRMAEVEASYCQIHLPGEPMRYRKDDCPECHPVSYELSQEDLDAVAVLVARGTATQDVAEYISSKTGLDVATAKVVLLGALPSMWV